MIQQTHTNYEHPNEEEFVRSLKLSRARECILNYLRKEFKCPACEAKSTAYTPARHKQELVESAQKVWITGEMV